jgi:hypothetical protein
MEKEYEIQDPDIKKKERVYWCIEK